MVVEASVTERLSALEAQLVRLRVVSALLALLFVSTAAWAVLATPVSAQDSSGVLRARGLVIEDAKGRARVVMGAPFPTVPDRRRQDTATAAMIFLDENGNDRLTLGEAPNPQVDGKVLHRIAPHFGVVIHDAKGDERGAYGFLANGRVVVTLDRPGTEAWAAVVNDQTGVARMVLGYPDSAGGRDAFEIGTHESRVFLRVKDTEAKDRLALELDKEGVPALQLIDAAGKPVRDVLQQK